MKKNIMRVASVLVLGVASFPVFAEGEFNEVPTPDMMSLMGIGILAVYLINKIK